LEKQLQVARVNEHRLICTAANQITVTDIIRPSGATIRLASERGALPVGLLGPRPAETRSSEGAKVPPVGPNGFNDHEILAWCLALDSIHLHGLEKGVFGVSEDNSRRGAEVAWKLPDRHTRSIYIAIVASKEEVHVGIITNHRLVDTAGTRAGDGAGEQRLF